MANNSYRIEYYKNSQNNKEPVRSYINKLGFKTQAKIDAYLDILRENDGRLREPYTKHIIGKIWELRIDFDKSHYRIFYFICIGKRIILLHAFLKKTRKTPRQEIEKAINSYKDFINSR